MPRRFTKTAKPPKPRDRAAVKGPIRSSAGEKDSLALSVQPGKQKAESGRHRIPVKS